MSDNTHNQSAIKEWETLYPEAFAEDGLQAVGKTYTQRDEYRSFEEIEQSGLSITPANLKDSNQTITLGLDTDFGPSEVQSLNSSEKVAVEQLDTQHISAKKNQPVRPSEPGLSSEKEYSGYRLHGELGRGGMGIVTAALQVDLHRKVALKKPRTSRQESRLVQEAIITGNLNHPNIVTVHDLLQNQQGERCISMQLIQGRPWKDKLYEDWANAEGHLSSEVLAQHLDILVRVAQAVEYAHHKGILHNDLKLENVMVGRFGDVVLMDWGCATSLSGTDAARYLPLTTTDCIVSPFGTPCYMSPEQARGEGKSLGTWSDTYLLGGMLYEVVEGQPHRPGNSIRQVLSAAIEGYCGPMEKCDSIFLKNICRKALMVRANERYQTVGEMLQELRNYFTVREAEKLVMLAEENVAGCRHAWKRSMIPDQSLILSLDEAYHTFEQAKKLWPSEEAKKGTLTCRALLAEIAIALGDLALAQANLDQLPRTLEFTYLREQLQLAKDEQEIRNRRAGRMRLMIRSLLILILFGLLLGNFFFSQQKEIAVNHAAEAQKQRNIANRRLQEIQALSMTQLVADLFKEESKLWPAKPQQSQKIDVWLQQALPAVKQLTLYRQRLETFQQRVSRQPTGRFTDITQQWEYEALISLVADLEKLQNHVLPQVQQRKALADNLYQRSIVAYREQWGAAIAAIARSPKYNQLQIREQLGLVPLGENEGGLWEFAHLLSGEIPKRHGGSWLLTKDTAIVLVLLPGGTFTMGADPKQPSRNHDPRAMDIEQPAHTVSLAPFFISKYEVSQAQWLRVMDKNPSAYLPGRVMGKHTVNLMHPVEHMTWQEAKLAMDKLDLTLPTEAQWEYANRADTQTIYWTGNPVSSLRGAVNISDRVSHENGGPASWKFEPELDDGHIIHAPIGSFRANPFGLHDTSGNVWEWCLDQFGSYTLATEEGTGRRMVEKANAPRLFRGGGFRASSIHARSADRYSIYANDYSAYDVGLRAAKALE